MLPKACIFLLCIGRICLGQVSIGQGHSFLNSCPVKCLCFVDFLGSNGVECYRKQLHDFPAGIPTSTNILQLSNNQLKKLTARHFQVIITCSCIAAYSHQLFVPLRSDLEEGQIKQFQMTSFNH